MARNFTVDTWDDPPEEISENFKIQKLDEILSLKKITKVIKKTYYNFNLSILGYSTEIFNLHLDA
jgi:hypothetical protein